MKHTQVKQAADLLKLHSAAEQYMRSAEQLPDDRVLTARFDLPDGGRIQFPISKKTLLNDLLAQQATITGQLAKLGVTFDEPELDEPAIPLGAPAGAGLFPQEGGRDPQPQR